MKNKNTSNIIKEIYNNGYCVVENVISQAKCDKIVSYLEDLHKKTSKNKNFRDEVSKYGQVIIRDLVLREPDKFLNLIDNKIVMKILKNIFKDTFILDNCMASNSVLLNRKRYKALIHMNSHLPNLDIKNSTDIVVMYCFNDFSKENGATKIWPKSHLSGVRVQNEKKYLKNKINNFKYAKAKKGSLIFFLGETWHQIGQNINGKKRWGILCHYKRWWIKPSTDFTKCGVKIFKKLNNKQKELFGFNSISPRFNFKKQIKNLKTLRKINKLEKEYYKVLQY